MHNMSRILFLILEASSFNGSRDLTIHPPMVWKKEFGTVLADSRETSRFGDGPVAHSFDDFRIIRRQRLRYVRIAHPKFASWKVQNYELNKDSGFVSCQTEQQAVLMLHRLTKVIRMTSIMEPSLIGDQVSQTGSSVTTQSSTPKCLQPFCV